MQQDKIMLSLIEYVLPKEVVDYFDIVKIEDIGKILNIYLDDSEKKQKEYKDIDIKPNDFYPESLIKDFPLRDRKVILHVRLRRWIDSDRKNYSRQWDLTEKGTRYSKEFAFFLKKHLDTCPITAKSLEKFYHIDVAQLERHYKEHLSNYNNWD